MPNIDSYFVDHEVPLPAQKQVILRDDHLQGFGLRVTSGGSKAFIVEGRVNGVVRRITIGKASDISAEAAREQAAKLLADMAAGNDPRPLKAPTLAEVLESYVTSKRLRASTVVSYRQVLTLHLTDWLDLPVNEINQHMVFQRHKELGEKLSHSTANLREHCIPLSDFVLNLLAEHTADSQSPFVFPGRAGTYCQQFSEVQEGIRQASGVTFTPDMLRRTFFDVALRIGVPSYALSAFENETRGQNATTLSLMGDMERLREPMQLITDTNMTALKVE